MDLLKKLGNFVWSKAFGINFAILIALYVTIFMVTKSCIKSSTNFGQKLEVPNLIGKNSNNIAGLMKGTELKYVILDSIYDPSKVSGTIIEQEPGASKLTDIYVKQGRTIKLRVSKRSMLVMVPNLIDKSQQFAEGVLRNRGFRYDVEYRPSREADGAVIDQLYKGKPIANDTKLEIGSRIKIIVGRNEVGIPLALPNLYGLSIVEARKRVEAMTNMEFFVGSCEGCENSADSTSARVYTQSPEWREGEMVASGSSITVSATLEFTDSQQPE